MDGKTGTGTTSGRISGMSKNMTSIETKTVDDCDWEIYKGDHWGADVEILDDRDHVLVERIDVDKGYRGHGIGTTAIREIASRHRAVYLCPDNKDAARLYARLAEKLDVCPLECLYYLDQGYGVYEVA